MQTYCTTCGHATIKQADNLGVCDQGHYNWVNPNPGATVFIVKDGKVLYGVRNMQPYKGQLNLPGGFLELGESAEQAAIREVKEELGVDIEIMDFLGTYPDDYEGRPTLNIMFIARHVSGEFNPSDDLNGGELTWRDISDLPTPDEFGWKWYVPAQRDLAAWWQKQAQ